VLERAQAAAALAASERDTVTKLLRDAAGAADDVQARYDLVRRQLQDALEGPAGKVVSSLMAIQEELTGFQAEADGAKQVQASKKEEGAKAKKGERGYESDGGSESDGGGGKVKRSKKRSSE
jgi:hypothetical protein